LYSRPANNNNKKEDFTNFRDTAIGWVACPLFDYKHQFRSGLTSLGLWPDDKANPIG
jgi:hypothetical protein